MHGSSSPQSILGNVLAELTTNKLLHRRSSAAGEQVNDCIQEACVVVLSAFPKLHLENHLRFKELVKARALDSARRWSRKRQGGPRILPWPTSKDGDAVDLEELGTPPADTEPIRLDLEATLEACISTLQPIHRKVIRLSLKGHNIHAIGTELNIKTNTAKSHLRRARAALALSIPSELRDDLMAC